MKTYRSTTSFARNQIGASQPVPSPPGPCQPPSKSVTHWPESVIRLMYSDIVYSPKRIPPYSVWYPATSSCSASGRSKGARAVSAVPAKRKTTSPTICGAAYQTVSRCAETISVSESDPAMITTPSTDRASATSYDTSCAQVRIEPSRAYFESEAQPPTT